MDQVSELLQRLSAMGILLEASNGKLKVFSRSGNVDDSTAAEIRDNRQGLLNFLADFQKRTNQQEQLVQVPVVKSESGFVVSPAQARVWTLCQVEDVNVSYNVSCAYFLRGRLDTDLLAAAFQNLVARHDSLRTCFIDESPGELKQYILPVVMLPEVFSQVDISRESVPEELAFQMIRHDFQQSFNLSEFPLFSAVLYQLAADTWIFSLRLHHIICDGWSMEIIIQEMLKSYETLRRKGEIDYTPFRYQYKDYAFWQHQLIKTGYFRAHQEYWISQFQGDLPEFKLLKNIFRSQPGRAHHGSGTERLFIADEDKDTLQYLIVQHQCTLYHLLHTLTLIVLYHNSHQQDIIIGTPVAGRGHPDFQQQVGLYFNTVPLRHIFPKSISFEELVRNITTNCISAFEFQDWPFDQLIDTLNLKPRQGKNILFDIWMVLHTREFIDVKCRVEEELLLEKADISGTAHSKFDLMFVFAEHATFLELEICYRLSAAQPGTIKSMCDEFLSVLRILRHQPLLTLDQISQRLTAIQTEREQNSKRARRNKNLEILKGL